VLYPPEDYEPLMTPAGAPLSLSLDTIHDFWPFYLLARPSAHSDTNTDVHLAVSWSASLNDWRPRTERYRSSLPLPSASCSSGIAGLRSGWESLPRERCRMRTVTDLIRLRLPTSVQNRHEIMLLSNGSIRYVGHLVPGASTPLTQASAATGQSPKHLITMPLHLCSEILDPRLIGL